MQLDALISHTLWIGKRVYVCISLGRTPRWYYVPRKPLHHLIPFNVINYLYKITPSRWWQPRGRKLIKSNINLLLSPRRQSVVISLYDFIVLLYCITLGIIIFTVIIGCNTFTKYYVVTIFLIFRSNTFFVDFYHLSSCLYLRSLLLLIFFSLAEDICFINIIIQ